MDVGLHFRLLGPLEVLSDGTPIRLGGARQRVVLAMLLLEPGSVVTVDRLVDAVWDDQPPATARSQIQMSVSDLRRRLGTVADPGMISTHQTGYRIELTGMVLDVTQFHELVARGRDAARRGDTGRGAADLRAALALWRGEAAAGMTSRLVQAAAVRLNEERLAVVAECIGLELELGRHHAVIGELRELLAAQPLREALHAHLMLALYRSGRQAEALAAYREAQRLLAEEHGIDPGEQLRAMERAILTNDPALDLGATPPQRVAPRQLPAAPPEFVGREGAAARIHDLLSAAAGTDSGPAQVVLVAITGPGGVGKTALALHTSHGVRDHFPDGQLFARLRDGDVRPARPEQVLDRFLRALGVPPTLIPTELEELAALYRSQVAGHRILVVLDDATSAAQVLPLLPGDPRCALLVTSRRALPGLHGAHRFDLDVLSAAAGNALLARILGQSRVRAEADAAGRLAESCGYLPLALRIAAAKLSVRPHWRLTQLVDRLGDERRRLDELSLDGVGVRASIAMSYRTLRPTARNLLLLLSMLGAGDFAGWVAGPLLAEECGAALDVLDELVEARLVEANASAAAGGQARHRLHDLIRIFAREHLARDIPAAQRVEAQQRVLRCWLFLVREAHRRHYGGNFTVLRSGAGEWPLPPPVVGAMMADPIAWFESERANLVTAIRLAAQLADDEVCWELAMASVAFFESWPDREAWRDTHEVALGAVRRAGNRRGEAAMRYSRGGLAIIEQRLRDAQHDLTEALAWFERAGDAHGRGLALRNLAFIDRLQGQYDLALDRYSAALADLRSVGDRGAEAHVLGSIAQVNLDLERLDQADRLLREALAICEQIGARRLEAQMQHRVGQLHLARRDLPRAQTAFTAVLQATVAANDPVGRAYAMLGAGQVRLAEGDFVRAGVALAEALETVRPTGHRLAVGRILLVMAELAIETCDEHAATARLAEAEALLTEIEVPVWQARAADLRRRIASPDRDRRPTPAGTDGGPDGTDSASIPHRCHRSGP